MPSHDFKSPRLFTDADLADGAHVEVTAAQANYLVNVLRLGDDDHVLVFNGRDGEWRTSIERPSRKRVVLRCDRRARAQTPAGDLHYLFAPLKAARLDYMVQKAVEMGATRLQPVMTQHVQAPRINLERMRANAIEAAEQCGVLAVPDCWEMTRLADLLEAFPAGRRLIFCDEREDAADPIAVLRREAASVPLSLLVGPEGGFSAEERALLRSRPFCTAISLGPRILRADTAAVAALAVLQACVGDWTAPEANAPPR